MTNQVCDPLFEKTILLLPFDNGETIDVKGHSVTKGTTAVISNERSKWGTTSAKFDGLTTSSLWIPYDPIFKWGSSNYDYDKYCIEFWFYPTLFSRRSLIKLSIKDSLTSVAWAVGISSAGYVYFSSDTNVPSAGSGINLKTAAILNQWNYVKITNTEIILNGVSDTHLNKPSTSWISSSYGIQIGMGYLGCISDLRITKGNDRSLESLLPTEAFPTISCIAPPVETPIVPIQLTKTSLVKVDASCDFGLYNPIIFSKESEITFLANAEFEKITPILVNMESEIKFSLDVTLRKTNVDVVYLPVENRSKFSTGFVDRLLSGVGIQTLFDEGEIEIYSGERPYSANHAVTGNLLGSISGVKFNSPFGREISKDDSPLSFVGLSDGIIGWYRIKSNQIVDTGSNSITAIRIDGEAGIDAFASNVSVKKGDIYYVDNLSIAWGNG